MGRQREVWELLTLRAEDVIISHIIGAVNDVTVDTNAVTYHDFFACGTTTCFLKSHTRVVLCCYCLCNVKTKQNVRRCEEESSLWQILHDLCVKRTIGRRALILISQRPYHSSVCD